MSAMEGVNIETTANVGAQRIAKVYAEALLNAAQKQGQAEQVLAELESFIVDVFPAEPSLEAFLSSGAIGRDRKAPVIRDVFGPRASEIFTNFLLVLNHRGRLDLLRPILVAARDLADERARRVRVRVRSAVPLPDDQRDRLSKDLRTSLGLEPVLVTDVDPEILGGLVVQVGDWQYDSSIRTQLNTLRNQLIERSNYAIQSRRDRFYSPDGN
jgi:F-type H+-transporting ATPase subunit delta